MSSIILKLIDDATNGAINKLGIAGVVTGGTNTIINDRSFESQPDVWLTMPNAVAIFSIVGSGMFIIKICVDIYFTLKKDRRENQRRNIDNSTP